MNPSRGLKAPEAIMSRSDSSREVSLTTSRPLKSSGRSPVRSTSSPPWGSIRPVRVPGTRTRLIATPPVPRRVDWSLPDGDIASDVSCGHLGSSETKLLEPVEDDARRLLRRMLLGVDPQLRLARLLVGIRDARELLDLAPKRLLVEALDVAARALLDRCRHIDLHERTVLFDQLAHMAPRFLVRRDRRDEHRPAVTRQPGGDPADPLDVRVAVLLREAEALREVRADDVAVQVFDHVTAALELGADDLRDRRLAGARKPRKPEGETVAQFVSFASIGVSRWMPHSSLSEPAQRPARSSSPGAVGRVHGMQPIDRYPASWSGLNGISLTWM